MTYHHLIRFIPTIRLDRSKHTLRLNSHGAHLALHIPNRMRHVLSRILITAITATKCNSTFPFDIAPFLLVKPSSHAVQSFTISYIACDSDGARPCPPLSTSSYFSMPVLWTYAVRSFYNHFPPRYLDLTNLTWLDIPASLANIGISWSVRHLNFISASKPGLRVSRPDFFVAPLHVARITNQISAFSRVFAPKNGFFSIFGRVCNTCPRGWYNKPLLWHTARTHPFEGLFHDSNVHSWWYMSLYWHTLIISSIQNVITKCVPLTRVHASASSI